MLAVSPEATYATVLEFNIASDKLDISKGQVGRLFPELNAFIIDPALGELEFEAEENELTLKVANMNGEFAIFLPQAKAGAAADAAGKE